MTAARSRRCQSMGAIFAGLIDPAPRPEYRGVQMRSRLETDFARYLDEQGLAWRYEPAVYGRYLPDFELDDVAQPTFIEVKPTLRSVPRAKRRMAAIWRAHPGALLIVACAEHCRWFAAAAPGAWSSWVDRWAH